MFPLVGVAIFKTDLTDPGSTFEHFVYKDDIKLRVMVHAYNLYPEETGVGNCVCSQPGLL